MQSESNRALDRTEDPAWPDQRYAWFVVIVLFLGSVLSFMDRQIIALLVADIKADLGLNDFEIGLLQGPPFGIFYAVMSVPLALLADRGNRRNLIVAGMTFWSLATAACGLAGSFWHLFLARIGVGSGEACLSPCAYSMISDLFRQRLLPLAMSVFTMGNLSGVGLAMIVGGAIIGWARALGGLQVPIVGDVAPWQLAFLLIGLPGVLLAVVVRLLREPVRRGHATPESASLAAFGKFVLAHRRTFATLFASFTMLVLVAYGNFAWVPSFFMRRFGWSASEAGAMYGMVVAIAGTGGALIGGWLASHLAGRGHVDAPYRATMLMSLPLAPLAVCVFVLAPDADWALAWFVPYQICSAAPAGLAATAMMTITPNPMRAKISSAYLFFSNFLGLSIGAAAVGFLTHNVFADDGKVGLSLLVVNLVGAPLAVLAILGGMRSYRESVTAMRT
ncbi:MAG: MFS transporter [Pseudomonadales bacterium]|nr:MFS transporter [Pseudomonadales bacterium]